MIKIATNAHYYSDEDGNILGVEGIARDITDVMALEDRVRRARRMEAIGQLTGGIAHEFNNLLGIMLGNAELLQERIGADEKARRNIEALIAAVDRSAALTQRLLAFSRQQALLPQPTAINDLVHGLEDMLQRTLGEAITLTTDVGTPTGDVLIDSYQFENALINLAVNARDAMPDGGVLTIKTANVVVDDIPAGPHEELRPGKYVSVSVRDTGTGISDEILGNVFEPFFTTREFGESSGLGLSMVYGFVKQSRGHITIDSKVNDGTTVNLYFPESPEAAIQKNIKDEAPHFAPPIC